MATADKHFTEPVNRALAYLASLSIMLVAVLLRWVLDPVLGDQLPLVTLFGAVALAVWLGGYGPALLATVVGYLACSYLFLSPRYLMVPLDAPHLVGLVAYLVSSGIIIWFGSALRVTRVRAERSALQAVEQQEHLRVTLASIGDAVIATNRLGVVTFLNPVAEALTGWKENDAVGRPLGEVFRIVNERTRQAVENPALKALESGMIVGLANHTVLIARDGTERVIDDSAAPIRSKEGDVTGVILVFRDVTERRRAQAARHQLAAIVESSEDAIIGKDLDGTITSWNRSAERLYGYSAREMIGKSKSLLMPADRAGELPAILERIRRGERVEPYETRRVRKDGSLMDVSITVSPVRDEHGEIAGAATIARDIGERKRAEAALQEADRRKNEFLAILAHELRNPLAPLSNALHTLKLDVDPETAHKALRLMERQLQHLVRLVDDLLDVSRITRGKIELRKERAELSAIIQSALETSQPLMAQFGHEVTVELPATPVFLQADVVRLAQVFANLLNNAAKYTARGGRIDLSASSDGEAVTVRIRDSGIGIPSEALHSIFDIFVQVDRSIDRAHGGLGIGLSLVRGLVELHGGTVEAHSAGPGRGSEFVVRIPLNDAGEFAAQHVEPAPPARPRRRILVVDDNPDSADSLALMLSLNGHEVRTAYDGATGVETANAWHPDAVLLDIGLPGLNGYEAARRIRGEPWAAGTLIVATTGWGHEEHKQLAQEAGFDFHLTKPVDFDALEGLLAGKAGRA